MKNNKNAFKVIQITDTHLFKDNSRIFGIESNVNFGRIIQQITRNDLKNVNAIFLTGDLSQDQSPESYQIIVDAMEKFDIGIYWIPGNHDSIEIMENVFKKNKNFHRTLKIETDYWNFIFLNTKESGTDCGYLDNQELNHLESQLKNNFNKSTAIIMHHHPIKVGTPLIDKYILKNRDIFWEIVHKNDVNLVITGHVHGDYILKNGNINIEASPATCLQWKKGSTDLKIENQIGYKIYYFEKNSYVSETKWWNN